MHLCLDIDDTITYDPTFFAKLTALFSDAHVTIVSFRTEREDTVSYLESLPIRYDELILSTDPERGKKDDQSLHQWKAELVNALQPDIFFEDMPEVVALIDNSIVVFMPCDEVIRGWIRERV